MADLNDAPNDYSIFDLPEGQDPFKMETPTEEESPKAEGELEDNDKGDPVEPQEEEKPSEEEPSEEPSEPKKLEPADDDLVPIVVDGKVEYVRWGEHKGSIMRQADYTRKTQKVSEQARMVEERETQLAQREAKLIEIFRDKQKLDALYTRLYGNPPAAPAKPEQEANPDELVTRADVDKTKTEVLTEAQRVTQQVIREELRRIEAERRKLEEETFVSTIKQTTEDTLDAVLKEHGKVLGHIPHVDRVLKLMAAESRPGSPEEVRAALVEAGKKLATEQEALLREKRKVEAAERARLEKGIEKGGTPPGRQRKSYDKKDGTTDWDALDADVVNFLESRMKR